ncbi:hypothetical protein [Streptomyces sp. NPDC002788]
MNTCLYQQETSARGDLTVAVVDDEAQAWRGGDARLLATMFAWVLHGVALLRTGRASHEALRAAMAETIGALEGLGSVRRAAVRQHAAQGGSHGHARMALSLRRTRSVPPRAVAGGPG